MRRVELGIFVLSALTLAAPLFTAEGGTAAPTDTLAISLDESVRLALAHNRDLKVMEEKVAEAQSKVREAGTAFLPQLTGSAGYTRLDIAPFLPTSRFSIFAGGGTTFPGVAIPKRITIGLTDNYSTSVKLQQPLFAGGKIKNAYDISRLAKSTAESELRQTTSELVFEVKRAYLACVKLREFEKVAGESVQQLEAHLRDLQAMSDAGLAATNDVLKTKVYHSESKLALMKAQHAVRLAKNNFCSIVDLPLSTEIAFISRADGVSPTRIDLDTAVRMGVEKRSEIRSMEYRKIMMKEEIATNRNGYFPDIYFFANLGYQYPDREYARDFCTTWSMGVLAQMNVFDWGRVVYKTRQSKSRLKQLEISEQSLKDGITLDVARTYLSLVEAWNEIEVARESVAQAGENYRVTDEMFKEGLATNTELLDAQLLLTNAKTTYRSAIVDYLIAQADLTRATGTPQD